MKKKSFEGKSHEWWRAAAFTDFYGFLRIGRIFLVVTLSLRKIITSIGTCLHCFTSFVWGDIILGRVVLEVAQATGSTYLLEADEAIESTYL